MSRLKLLRQREEGRFPSSSSEFARRALYGDHSTWRPSHKHQIHAFQNSGTSTTALDLESRWLLSGSSKGDVSIHDIWSDKKAPLQLAKCPRDHSLLAAVQWYPVDNGVFFTASAAGSVSIWDTNSMEVVLTSKPFEFTETSSSYALRCMSVSNSSLLAAVGSNGSSTVKLMDLQSGATSHSLSFAGCHSGVTAVRWSSTNPNLLASCSGTVVLWDIRRPNCVLATLNEEDRPSKPDVSTSYYFDSSHFLRKGNKLRKTAKDTATSTTATNVVFDQTGKYLVSVCGRRRTMSVWDLRFAPKPIRQLRNFVSENSGKPVERSNTTQPLMVTGEAHEQLVWVTRDNKWVGYPLLYDPNGDGKPAHVLRGHLGKVQAATTHSHLMVTAATDSVVLTWERGKVPKQQRPFVEDDDW